MLHVSIWRRAAPLMRPLGWWVQGTMISLLKLRLLCLLQRLPLPPPPSMRRHAQVASGAPLVLVQPLTRLCSPMDHPLTQPRSAASRQRDSTRLQLPLLWQQQLSSVKRWML